MIGVPSQARQSLPPPPLHPPFQKSHVGAALYMTSEKKKREKSRPAAGSHSEAAHKQNAGLRQGMSLAPAATTMAVADTAGELMLLVQQW